MSATKARSLAVLAIAALEGALVMARATRDTSAIATAGEEVADLVRRQLSVSSARKKAGSRMTPKRRG
ncbi:MAG: hypothetical protein AB1762_12640 [Gemmatimonadota bacterium]